MAARAHWFEDDAPATGSEDELAAASPTGEDAVAEQAE
jgi:hypothetical protein